jgi:hypothetical protein
VEDIKSILDRIIKEEFGGCDPRTDNPCKIQARVSDGMIYAFAVGKWRVMGRAGRKYPPSQAMLKEAEKTLRINTGSTGSGAAPVGVFDGKVIEFVFFPTKEENDANLIWKL